MKDGIKFTVHTAFGIAVCILSTFFSILACTGMSNDAGNLKTDFAIRTPRVQEPSVHMNTVNLDKLLPLSLDFLT